MGKKKLIVSIALFVLIITSYVYAFTLNIDILADKNKVRKIDEVTIEVKWDKEMQAADFSLNYDSKKLEYIKSDIDDIYIDSTENGVIKTAWISIDNTNKTNIKYIFKVLKTGKLKFNINVDGGFATGELEIPSDYNVNELKIESSNTLLIVIIILIVLIIVFIVTKIILKKRKNNKKWRKK